MARRCTATVRKAIEELARNLQLKVAWISNSFATTIFTWCAPA
jgi:hypothetical protein